MSRWLRLRWTADRLVAAVLGVVLAPLVGVVAVLVRRHDGGPALVALPRVGRAGRPFAIRKLRSMPFVQPDGGAGGSPLTTAGDARVTPLGRTLRRTRLDEVPQLLNVVEGQMALLGPRPETPPFVDLDDPRWQDVLRARPGIAGPTQVIVHHWESRLPAGGEDVYRHELLPVKLAIDAWYLRRASPWLDVVVVVSLVQSMLHPGGSTALHRRVLREVPEAALLAAGPAAGTDAGTADGAGDGAPAGEV